MSTWPVDDLHAFTRQRDDALDVNDVRTGEPDGDNVAAGRRVLDKGEPVDELERARFVCRLHADPLRPDGDQHPAKRHEANRRKDEDPDGRTTWMGSKNDATQQAHTSIRLKISRAES